MRPIIRTETQDQREKDARRAAEQSIRERLRALAIDCDREAALSVEAEDLPRRERLRGARDGVVRALRELG